MDNLPVPSPAHEGSRPLEILRRRRVAVALALLLTPLAAYFASVSQPKRYSAAASLLFRESTLGQGLLNSTGALVQPDSDADRQAATNIRLVSLPVVAQRTAERIGTVSMGEVRGSVKIVPQGNSNVVQVVATRPSPGEALRMANVFAAEYVDFRREADREKIENARNLIEDLLDGFSPAQRKGARGRRLEQRAEDLQVLSSLQTGNAEFVQHAALPGAPSSPHPVRSAVIGLMFGLIIAAILVVALERFDVRIRDSQEAERLFDRPLLGVIPRSRGLRRVDAFAFATARGVESETFLRLWANLRYFRLRGDRSVILITSPSSGDGKSTVSLNAGIASARSGRKTLIIDADLRRAGVSAGIYGRARGLSEILTGSATLDEVAADIEVPDTTGSLQVVTAGALPPNPVDLIDSEEMRELLRTATSSYDAVIVDAPPITAVSDAIPLARDAAGVLVVVRADTTDRRAARHLRNDLENLGANVLGIVFNGARPSGSYDYKYGYSSTGKAPPRLGRQRDSKPTVREAERPLDSVT